MRKRQLVAPDDEVQAPTAEKAPWTWEWTYVIFVIALFAFVPGLRRYLDWRSGSFGAIQILSLVPLASLLPLLVPAWKRRRRISKTLRNFLMIWFGVLAYAMLLSAVAGNVAAAAYEFITFAVPPVLAVWLATLETTPDVAVQRIAAIVLGAATLTSLYGIYQFINPPPWDAFWVISSDFTSAGAPEPYSMRIFSTLNAPGPYADFLVVSILLGFSLVRMKTIWLVAPIGLCLAALGLTLVRADWIALCVGMLAYVLLSPRLSRSIPTLVVIVALGSVLVSSLPSLLGDSNESTIVDRLNTLTDVDDDISVQTRRSEIAEIYAHASAKAIGDGLGLVGPSAKLASADDQGVVDSGYLARFEEFGYLGFFCYLIVTIGVVIVAVMRSFQARAEAIWRVNAFAVAGSIAIILAVMDFAVDSHASIDGVFFWIGVGLMCWQPVAEPSTASAVASPKRLRSNLPQFGGQRL